ncbi:hypothetical protein VRB78_13560 [Pseudomonas trivialis]|uniref:hypothetical protein n=1 Tax=Pseudomonas trivialis TaxID=200450 RepID=UPI0030CFF832
MNKQKTSPSIIPKAGIPFAQQAAKNIANARKSMQDDTAAGRDLTDSATKLREAIAASCRGSHREWVTGFATGRVPYNKPLTDDAIELLKLLEQELEEGEANIDTLKKIDEMLAY